MHIPDGFLSANTCLFTWLLSAAGLGVCVKKTKKILKERMVPLMGVVSAFIFAAQMLNFPVVAGTSGHLLGGVLAAVLVGPWAGAIVIACVLIVQCLVFQDGGLTALGANILNMSFAGSLGSYFIYAFISKVLRGTKGVLTAVAVAAWLSVVMASALCSLELGISRTSEFSVTLVSMVSVHALIGMGEAVITVLVVAFVLKTRPDLVYNKERV